MSDNTFTDHVLRILESLLIRLCSSQQSSVKAQLDKMRAECVYLSNESANNMAEIHKDLSHNITQLRDMTKGSAILQLRNSIEDKEVLTEIRMALSKLFLLAKNITLENAVLKVLYFKSMYQRQDSISDPDGGSFRWILEPQVERDFSDQDSRSSGSVRSFHSTSTGSFHSLVEGD